MNSEHEDHGCTNTKRPNRHDILGLYRGNTPIMGNQMEKKMENEMETGITMGYII